ncbi:phosphoribosyltransferase family protein [Streptomyces sp. NPDC048606]|uniref:ComF family protein n=1 Tax=Streptomyces sp. NPDC048606 TaxID=3154726 RepID=UPI00342BDA26
MRGWWREVSGLVLAGGCEGCGAAGAGPRLCARCRAALGGARAGRVRPAVRRAGPVGLPAVYAGAPYEGVVRTVLLAHKERGALPLAGPLGRALAAAVLCAGGAADRAGGDRAGDDRAGDDRAGGDRVAGGGVRRDAGRELVLVPVPSARRTVRARGHDPARRIALAASARLRAAGVPARVVPLLEPCRPVEDQAGLGAARRFENLAGALRVRPGGLRAAAGARILLVDDLITTGATLAEAARALRAAGAAPEAAAVVAAPGGSFERIRPYPGGGRRPDTRTEQKSCE